MPDVEITISERGSYKVEGRAEVFDHEGNRIETREGIPFFLCRCGQSSNKPFCDGTHDQIDWDWPLAQR